MPGPDGEFETFLTLVLADADPELAKAHDELYPERIAERIPFSLTLLYPFAPAGSVADAELEQIRSYFASRPPLAFSINRVAQWKSNGAVYGVPEPDDQLRATMRGLWELFPQYPPYRRPGLDPPPHASLTRDSGADRAATLEQVQTRLTGLLPAHFEIDEVALLEEYEPDRMRWRESFSLGSR